ncbi:MAG: IPT/TIG domain-containing protein [Planctomycetota bacterium]
MSAPLAPRATRPFPCFALIGFLTAVSAVYGQYDYLGVDPTWLSYTVAQGGDAPAARNIAVTSGGNPLSFTVSISTNPSGWLAVSPLAGSTAAVLTVRVNPAGLLPGDYVGIITITAPAARNSPANVRVNLTVTRAPLTVSVNPTSLTFNYRVGGPAPPAQTVSLNGNRSSLTFNYRSLSALGVSVSPRSGTLPATLTVSFSPAPRLLAGTYNETLSFEVTWSPDPGEFPSYVVARLLVAVNVSSADPSDLPPTVTAVVNAASFLAGPVAPGEVVTLFGSRMGPLSLATLRLNTAGLVDNVLSDTRVLFDGVPAPLIYTSASQVSATVPYGVAGRSSTSVEVEYRGKRSSPLRVPVSRCAPAIFTLSASGKGQGAVLNQNVTVNSLQNPADIGSIVALYATGEGQTIPAGVDGKVAAGQPLAKPVLPVEVRIDGISCEVLYGGAAPGLVAGVLQVNARVPNGVGAGEVPLFLRVGEEYSPPGVTLAVSATSSRLAANVDVSFSPNPVSRAPDGYWYPTVTLRELRGGAVTLTRMIVGGDDWTSFISSMFGTTRIPGYGRLTRNLRLPCVTPCPTEPFNVLWEVFGNDDRGYRDVRWVGVLRFIP